MALSKPRIKTPVWPFPIVGPLSKASQQMIAPKAPPPIDVVKAILQHRNKSKRG